MCMTQHTYTNQSITVGNKFFSSTHGFQGSNPSHQIDRKLPHLLSHLTSMDRTFLGNTSSSNLVLWVGSANGTIPFLFCTLYINLHWFKVKMLPSYIMYARIRAHLCNLQYLLRIQIKIHNTFVTSEER